MSKLDVFLNAFNSYLTQPQGCANKFGRCIEITKTTIANCNYASKTSYNDGAGCLLTYLNTPLDCFMLNVCTSHFPYVIPLKFML
jgi:hypothetical protein